MYGSRLVLVALPALIFSAHSPSYGGEVAGKITVTVAKTSADVVVYLEPKGDTVPVTPPDTAVFLNQLGKEFIPHVLPVVRGTTVAFFNNDDFLHNIHGYRQTKTVFNVAMPYVGMKWKKKFDEAGKVTLLCDVHPEMSAYIIVLNTPYFAKTGKDGAFVIPHVPAGEYVLQTWHEKGKSKTLTITISESDTTAVNLQLGD